MGKYAWSDQQDKRREERRPKPVKQVLKLKPKSKRLAKEGKLYTQLARKFLEENCYCQCAAKGCTGHATQVHHKKGRGIWFLIVKYFMAVCDNCHKHIHNNDKESRENGWLLDRIE